MNYSIPFLFLQGFLKNPKRVGSLFPSQKFLVNKIIQAVPWHKVKSIAELGAGTGAITKHIDNNKTKGMSVFVFERDKKMRETLKRTYPLFKFHSNASFLSKRLLQENINQLDCIICGLPFFSFSPEMRQRIMHQMLTSLKSDGTLIVYQNTLFTKKWLAEHLIIDEIRFELFNLPPAFIYICRKKT